MGQHMCKRTLRELPAGAIHLCLSAVIGFAVTASLVQAKPTDGESKRPNVILIYTDDQDFDEVGCYGGDVTTPNMDRLARNGMHFTRFYTASPVCTPSRYNVISGRYASRSSRTLESFPAGGPVNVGWEAGVIGEKTLPHALQAGGYVTGIVGKWHIGIHEEPMDLPIDADPHDPNVKRVLQANYEASVKSIRTCGFDYVANVYGLNPSTGKFPPKRFWLPKKLQAHNMEWLTEGTLKFIEQNKNKPFFLYMAPTLMHAPPAQESIAADPRITPHGYLKNPPDVKPTRKEIRKLTKGMGRKQAGALWLDAHIGTIVNKLEELGLTDNTAIFIASDNGRIGKFTCYDGGARTLFLAYWKGVIPPGKTCTQLTSNIDLAPTILEMCGIKPPADMKLDGQSIVGLLKDSGEYKRETLFLEITTERAVVTEDGIKYIAVRYPPDIQKQVDAGKMFNHWCQPMEKNTHTMMAEKYFPNYFDQDQLYDLNNDPKEQKNLIDDPQYQDRLKVLKQRLREYSAQLPHTFGEFTNEH